MNPRQVALWKRIQSFEFDGPDTRLRFADRLARENGWSAPFARRVLEEYQKFAFLAVEVGHPVTPSEQVDQAWHLHLVYTRSYWEEFCPDYLGKPLHHGPTKGGTAENEKYTDWYGRTTASYERLFGTIPPTDIWPPAEERFDRDLAWRRVNWQENWILPKREIQAFAKYGAAACVAILLVGCAGQAANPLNWKGGDFLLLYALLFIACLFWNFALRWQFNPVVEPAEEPSLTEYEVAYLRKGSRRVFVTATACMVRDGILRLETSPLDSGYRTLDRVASALRVRKERFAVVQGLPAYSGAVNAAVVEAHRKAGEVALACQSFHLPDELLRNGLIEKGILVSDRLAYRIRFWAVLPLVGLLLFGLLKIAVGTSRDKPVGFLIFFSIFALITIVMVMRSKPRLSGYGKLFMKALGKRHREGVRSEGGFRSEISPAIGMDVAIAGPGALIGTDLDSVGRALRLVERRANNSSGASGGCSSGGCGGGGGGCGGGGCGGCGS